MALDKDLQTHSRSRGSAARIWTGSILVALLTGCGGTAQDAPPRRDARIGLDVFNVTANPTDLWVSNAEPGSVDCASSDEPVMWMRDGVVYVDADDDPFTECVAYR